MDETSIKVLESEKKAATHMGWYWVYHSPLDGLVLMDYQPTHGPLAIKKMLANYSGYLQSDGYAVYQKIGQRPQITALACWAHAHREFERALDNLKVRASKALHLIQQLYAVERKIKEEGQSSEQSKVLRLNDALPIINELGNGSLTRLKRPCLKAR